MIINDKTDRKIKPYGKVKESGKPEEVFAIFGSSMSGPGFDLSSWNPKRSEKTADSGLTPNQVSARSGQLREKIAEKVFEETQQAKIGS